MAQNKLDPFSEAKSLIRAANTGYKFSIGLDRFIRSWALKRRLTQQGYDPITIANAVQALKNGDDDQVEAIIFAADQARRALKRQEELIQNPPSVHGDAHWADAHQLHDAGLLQDLQETPGGIYFGKHEGSGKPIHWQGQSHLLTLAPTRTGKSVQQIIPNLLRYKGSAVVLDPR